MTRVASLLSLCFFIFVLPLSAFADLKENRNQLKVIQQRIENTQVDLQHKQQSEQKFSRDLAVLKQTLSRLDKRISGLQKEQRRLQTEVDQQKVAILEGKNTLRHIGRRLEKRLVALYKEGEIGPLKILFSADSPTELVQQYHYLTRVVGYDRELLGEYRQAIDEQQQKLARLEALNSQKLNLLDKEKQERKVAADGRRLQARLLKRVKSEKKQLSRELASLQEKAKRLQGLVKRLQQERQVSQATLPGSVNFSTGKGKLGWPVNGVVLIGFGTKKDKALGTYYESNGIEIAVSPGTSIRAVADGKVVYADWFNGYGNLMIVSHPGGYHTLYAQAEQLAKAPGEQIHAGDIVGKSGLGGRDSIYFEIRRDGSPVNPLNWLQRR